MDRPVLEDVDLRFERGVTAIVGANGAGKSTLLALVAGMLAPSAGSVRLEPDAYVAFVPADALAVTPLVSAFAAAGDGEACALRGQLALGTADLARWASLSTGERRRWQLGAALASRPDVLLLDEPDGHLDEASRRLVVGVLARFRGIVLMVTHDRALVDAVATAIVRVHDGTARTYGVPYDAARAAWEAERAGQLLAHAQARADERALAARLDEARRRAEAAQAATSSRTRMKGPRDADARNSLAKGLARRAAARSSRDVHALRSAHARSADAVPFVKRDVATGRDLFVRAQLSASPVAIHLEAQRLGPDGVDVLRHVVVTVTREDRVRIHGPNGAGKSTLVRALLAAAPVKARVGYLPQELEPDDVARHLSRLAELPDADRGRVLSLVAALGADPARIAAAVRAPRTLSSGEAKKTVLASLLASEVSVLVLDEPTNHLDLASIERLEPALAAYPGALVLVTHDDAFADACTRRVVHVGGGTVR